MKAENLRIDFPIYGVSTRSIKAQLLNLSVGGGIFKNQNKIPFVRALNNLNFEFNEGDRVGIYGHNGAGKSTLLKVLAGVYEANMGSLRMNGRTVSMLSLGVGLNYDATGYENIFLLGTLLGYKKSMICRNIDDIITFSELGEYIHLPFRTYSSGMQMRLMFSVITSIAADIVLMDEWISVGDAAFNVKAQKRLEKLLDHAKVFFIASHNKQLIKNTCNWMMHLQNGEIFSLERL